MHSERKDSVTAALIGNVFRVEGHERFKPMGARGKLPTDIGLEAAA